MALKIEMYNKRQLSMCLALYLFTDNLLEEKKFEQDNPNMYIRQIDLNREHAVLKWSIEKQNIYYIGSSQGCGCGWSEIYESDDENERSEKTKDRESLFNLLKQQNFTNSHLIICWEGDQGMDLKANHTLDINDIRRTDFEIVELVDYLIDEKGGISSIEGNEYLGQLPVD